MTIHVQPLPERDAARLTPPGEAGLGALATERGNLPLEALDVRAATTGLTARTVLTQTFHNPHDQPLEATYIFPLPDRAAVTELVMEAADHVVEGVLKERGEARADYDRAIAAGRRAAIAEEERPGVFTMRVGNVMPGERVRLRLALAGPLPYEDGEATYRFPLVVAPRYIPGAPLEGPPVGEGTAPDTDAVPDASRITPPVLLPGFPFPVRLSIQVQVDPAGLPLSAIRSTLHAVAEEEGPGGTRTLEVHPGERADRDFVLRLRLGGAAATTALALAPDPDGGEGTFALTVLPPAGPAPARPRDVVFVLDRSGSMAGWKMVAARRAVARMVDTLVRGDRFAVLAFDNTVETPPGLPPGLVDAADPNRAAAVAMLAELPPRGGTELLPALLLGLDWLAGRTAPPGAEPEPRLPGPPVWRVEHPSGAGASGHPAAGAPAAPAGERAAQGAPERLLVLVTDGQVGNEDQLLRALAGRMEGVRLHAVGIDRAVNAALLNRLAGSSGGRCELVESEERLDQALDAVHRRLGAPLVTGLNLEPGALDVVGGTLAPSPPPDLHPGAPVVLTGRYRGEAAGEVALAGSAGGGGAWRASAPATVTAGAALTTTWARAHLRDLEDRYAVLEGRHALRGGAGEEREALERRIVDTSLRFGVLCRFTAFVAVDTRVVNEGGEVHRVVQPVEPASGWDMLHDPAGGSVQAMSAQAMPSLGPAVRAMPARAAGGLLAKQPVTGGLAEELAACRRWASEELERLRALPDDPARVLDHLVALGEALDDRAGALARAGAPRRATGQLRQLAVELRHPGGEPRAAATILRRRAELALASLAAGRHELFGAGPGSRARDFWKA